MSAVRTTQPPDGQPIRLPIAPDVLTLFWVDNIAIMAWHKPASAAVVEALYQSGESRRRQYPTGMCFVHIGRIDLAKIDGETRDAFIRVTRLLRGYGVATAFVTQASGFLASSLRSLVTGVLVVVRGSLDLRFHENVEELLAWLPAKNADRTGIQVDVERLRSVLLRAQGIAS